MIVPRGVFAMRRKNGALSDACVFQGLPDAYPRSTTQSLAMLPDKPIDRYCMMLGLLCIIALWWMRIAKTARASVPRARWSPPLAGPSCDIAANRDIGERSALDPCGAKNAVRLTFVWRHGAACHRDRA